MKILKKSGNSVFTFIAAFSVELIGTKFALFNRCSVTIPAEAEDAASNSDPE